MVLALFLLASCDAEERNAAAAGQPDALPQPNVAAPVVLFLGTSLTAGYGVLPEDAYPALVQEKIDSAGLPHRVINAGVSGETSAGALRRVDWLLRQPFEVLVLETGANDMLRGSDVDSTRANIQAIIGRVRATRPEARIVLAGMLALPNLGADYVAEFRSIYPAVAEENQLPLVPFLLEGVGGVSDLNLPDGIHPNAEGHRRIAENVWEVLEPELEVGREGRASGQR